ncbi:family 78 glycoside hydrolase catalytic domain [Propionibacteriaceae bacterium Y1685]
MKAPDEDATWITAAEWQRDHGPLPVLATVLELDEVPPAATWSIAGLGVHQTKINGVAVSADLLEPGYTDYARWAEWTNVDVARLLHPGPNVISVELGPGMYRSQAPDGRWTKVFTDYGDLGVCAVLHSDPTSGQDPLLTTDLTWHGTTGPVRSSNWVGGEDFDAAYELDLSPDQVRTWPRAVPAAMPTELRLRPKTIPGLRVIDTLDPVAVTEPSPGVHVIDFGVNFAGWPVLDLPAGVAVRLRPAEVLHPDGMINEITEGWGPVLHTVRTTDARTWHPSFMYNGLRFLEVTALDEESAWTPTTAMARGWVIAANTPSTGSFVCSNTMINDVHRIIRRAVTSNMYSVFTDCPQREKLCYLEQLHLVFDVLRWNYDCESLLANSLQLTRDAQEESGHIALYVPEWDPFPDPWRGDPNWGLAIVLVPWQLYRAYGNRQVLIDNLDAARAYVGYLLEQRTDGLITYGLGDWDGTNFRYVPLVTTAVLARAVAVLADIVDVVGGADTGEAAALRATADELITTLRARFVSADGTVGDGSTAELAIGLQAGLVPDDQVPAVLDRLCARLEAEADLSLIGEIGIAAVVAVLGNHDRHETLFALSQWHEKPSYGYMLAHGATALTERWDGPTFGISQNHFMNGALDDWFFTHVAGLGRQGDDLAFTRLLVRPRPCGDLTSASASYATSTGEYAVAWQLDHDQLHVTATIPPGATALVDLDNGEQLSVGHGSHSWTVSWPRRSR